MTQYQVGGSLHPDHPYYIHRQADTDLYQILSNSQFCYIFNARQMGKSSLMVHVSQRLQQDGVYCAAIDLSRIGSETLTPEQWYKGLAVELWQAFHLVQTINLRQWWNQQSDLSFAHRLGQFIQEILLVEVGKHRHCLPNLVIFLDEVDSIRGLDFSLNDFFGLIRACYNRRSLQPEYQRLTFALLGVTTPSDLISSRHQTPFNIGQAINLCELHAADAYPLAQGLVGSVNEPEQALHEVLAWTGGQPFLVQKVCQLIVDYPVLNSLTSDKDHIAQVIQNHVIQAWEFHDEPQHLRTIRDRLLSQPQHTGRLLGIYQQILAGESIEFDSGREQIELLLSGLVINQQGYLVVKNPIYRAVFNNQWIRQQLTQLRPYASDLDAWLAAGKQDEMYLLRGQTLQDALTWTLGKSLSNEDYQFLGASQELSKRETQTALDAVNHASQLLASARQQANQEVRKRRISSRWIPAITLSITFLLVLLRNLGLFQGMELNLYDQFVQWRPLEPVDSRIVLVTVDEQDIKQVGYPFSDRVLAQVITTIQTQKPRVIGLDIYRDLPVEPGHLELVQVFQSTPNLVGIEKSIGDQIAPPPILKRKGQIGFSDQYEDADGKVRRALLSVLTENTVEYSLAVQLSLQYLAAENITLEKVDSSGKRLRLGKAIFIPFQKNDGAYVQAIADGYQILLNFRGMESQFQAIPLRKVLNQKVPPDLFRDRLVLIGYTAESANDRFRTPYNGGWFNSAPSINGVTLHANIVSQIISAAIDGRSLIQVWAELAEWLWILLGTGVGAGIAWGLRVPLKILIHIFAISSGLVGGCYLAFLMGWWIPVIPPSLGMWGAAISLIVITDKKRDQLRLQRTLTLLLNAQQIYPVAGRIAIEYLNQSETKEYQAIIKRQINSL